MDEELLRDLPEEYAALADRRTVMLEVAAQLGELHAAVTELGDALERAGLPGREWRAAGSRLRLLPGPLPNITVDALITRLAEFSAGKGPDWLRGGRRDLESFHREVAAIYAVVRRLRHIGVDLREDPGRGGRGAQLARAVASHDAGAALDRIATILGDFEALRPFMAPLPPREWQGGPEALLSAGPAAQSGIDQTGWMGLAAAARGVHETLPLPPSNSHTRLRDFAPKDGADGDSGRARRVIQAVLALPRQLRSIRSWRTWPQRRKELAAIAVVLVLALAGIALEVAHAQPSQPGAPSPASHAAGPAATSTLATVTLGPAATATPAPTRTPIPPRLTLTCASAGTTAKLTVQNVGVSAVTWQAQASRSLTVSPSQGSLASGQTTTAQVSSNGKRQATGTVTVVATTSGRSASYSVSC